MNQAQSDCRSDFGLTRRDVLRFGALGLSLPGLFAARAGSALARESAPRSFGRAKSCIILFSWGGISHIDTFDPKPDASKDIRGEFQTIPTTIPGVHFSEHMPRLAKQTHRMAVVRSVQHKSPDHRMAAYWSLTGHRAAADDGGGVVPPVLPSRHDWPSIGSMVACAIESGARTSTAQASTILPGTILPGTMSLPYPIADRGLLNGQFGGFLGVRYDPVYVRPKKGKPYPGKSPTSGTIKLDLPEGLEGHRLNRRRELLATLESTRTDPVLESAAKSTTYFRQMAFDMLAESKVRECFEVEREPRRIREMYGEHICGQSVLLARRLAEAGVPLLTVFTSAGDLNSGAGAHWDTHTDNFNRLQRDLLPPLEQASSALLDDLAARGSLDDVLVVWLTEFGRTPKINGGGGRDHYPGCYSVAFAGGGIRGGQVYGKSDINGTTPIENRCGPADLHATIFHALGIDPHFTIHDLQGRPFPLNEGKILPLF